MLGARSCLKYKNTFVHSFPEKSSKICKCPNHAPCARSNRLTHSPSSHIPPWAAAAQQHCCSKWIQQMIRSSDTFLIYVSRAPPSSETSSQVKSSSLRPSARSSSLFPSFLYTLHEPGPKRAFHKGDMMLFRWCRWRLNVCLCDQIPAVAFETSLVIYLLLNNITKKVNLLRFTKQVGHYLKQRHLARQNAVVLWTAVLTGSQLHCMGSVIVEKETFSNVTTVCLIG